MNPVARLGFAIVAIAALIIASDSFYVLKEFEQAVVLRFGKFVKVVSEPGLHIKLPVVLQVVKYDKRLLDHDVPPTEIVTKDKRTLVVDSFSKWRIVDVEKYYKRIKNEVNARGRIKDIIYSEMWQEFGQHTLEEIVSINRALFMKQVTARANEKANQVDMGIEIVDVRIKRADLPEENQHAVFQRMIEERKRIATQFRSEGEEEANKIRAEADKEKTILLADAYLQEQAIRGEGDAMSIKIYADAYGQGPEFYEFIRSLEAYSTALESRNSIVLTDESEFLRFFNKAK